LSKEALGDGDGLGEAEAEEEGVAEDFGFARGVAEGFSEGLAEGFCNGFTGPVGLSGVPGVGLGDADGEGAAIRPESGRQTASAKMKVRNLMATAARSCGGNLRRRFARCQKFPHGRSSSRPDTGFSL
jgi:hypothetical protein